MWLNLTGAAHRARKALALAPLAGDAARMEARLDRGAGRQCLFLPFLGEFGHLIMTHIRLVHFSRAKEKIVCCRRGEEVFFPSAADYVTDWRDPLKDEFRVATNRGWKFDWSELARRFENYLPIEAGDLTGSEELYAIEPKTRIEFKPKLRGLAADVVLGVRRRNLFTERNWQHWSRLASALIDAGYSVAVIGRKETAPDVNGQLHHSGDYPQAVGDASIELLRNCRLYVGGDSGNSHLAATVGAQMLLFRETASGSRDLTGRMAEVNRGRIGVVAGGWENPQRVIESALDILNSCDAQRHQCPTLNAQL